jgi:N-carbamoyl-L-amino-acid hydrolase
MNLVINQTRLSSEIEALAAISEAEPPVVTRVVFGPADMKARSWLIALCEKAGLSVRQDAIGNTFARWMGSDAGAPAVGTGSHIDAIPNSIELLVFTSEEPTRFGIGCLGSRLLSGTLSAESAHKLTDKDGQSLDVVRGKAGIRGDIEGLQLPSGYYKAFVELHIEQGPLLEEEGVPLGIVTKIAAPASLRVVVEGSGGHAGALLMPDRRDALCAAAEVILAIENAAKSTGAVDTVATVGICDVFPGAINSVPSRVSLGVDIRDTDMARRDGVLRDITKACDEISRRRQAPARIEPLNADAPATCAPELVEALSKCCTARGLKFMPIVSRAYHDSLFMSRIAPVVMLFIPCHKGYSHRPDEYASPEDISRGVLILADMLASLSAG